MPLTVELPAGKQPLLVPTVIPFQTPPVRQSFSLILPTPTLDMANYIAEYIHLISSNLIKLEDICQNVG